MKFNCNFALEIETEKWISFAQESRIPRLAGEMPAQTVFRDEGARVGGLYYTVVMEQLNRKSALLDERSVEALSRSSIVGWVGQMVPSDSKNEKPKAPPSARMMMSITAWAFVCILGMAVRGQEDDSNPLKPPIEQLEFFEKEIRPLLAEHCFECHSRKANRLKAELFLDSRQGMLKGGESGPALVASNADESLLIQAVRYDSFEMPPKGKLPAKDIAALTRWVSMGAPWPTEIDSSGDPARDLFDLNDRKEKHWVWQPIQNPPPPAVVDQGWPTSTIDSFVLSKLESASLKPANQADKSVLVRRLYFDLIGLPPTPEQVQVYLNDNSEHTTKRLVDQLLDSPQFGERWGRHWLDLMRYAESRGHEFDNDAPYAYQYRDYVIRALNANVTYDQFVREHIAGDLLHTPRLNPAEDFNESVLGTGFWHLGEWVHSPVDIRKDESDRFDNMIDVMSKAFLGVTLSCARCHDHKF
ncbi:MAG TPA: DUF1549 domain-containing protein, partial [Pirellula sp.]|nr:DUF1549 domain-containing protein [Pirellula sp.]